MMKVALVTNVLSSYRIECFNRLHEFLQGRIKYYFLAKDILNRGIIIEKNQQMFDATWLHGFTMLAPPPDPRHLNNIMPVLKEDCDVIIVGGWDEPTYLLLWFWALLKKKKFFFWIETTQYDAAKSKIKNIIKRILLKHAKGCIVPGSRARDFCKIMGMSEDSIFTAPNPTDVEYYRGMSKQLNGKKESLKKELNVEGINICFVGRLYDNHKNLTILLNAFSRLKQSFSNLTLLIIGDGPDRVHYQQMIEQSSLQGDVKVLGLLNKDEVCRAYAASDVFVLPSRWEPWGFVLNEAMEFGLPLIVSDAVGAGPDLVHEGENGFVFPVGDVDALTKHLSLLCGDAELRGKMGEASKKIISDFTPEHWAQGVVHAIMSGR